MSLLLNACINYLTIIIVGAYHLLLLCLIAHVLPLI